MPDGGEMALSIADVVPILGGIGDACKGMVHYVTGVGDEGDHDHDHFPRCGRGDAPGIAMTSIARTRGLSPVYASGTAESATGSATTREPGEEDGAEEGDEDQLDGEDDEIEEVDAVGAPERDDEGPFRDPVLVHVAPDDRERANGPDDRHRAEIAGDDVPMEPAAIRHGQSKRSGSASFWRKKSSV